jgi:nucleotide-binding universal stress UspA family protein
MQVIRTILHPTDFSTTAKLAMELAHAIARDHGARLIVLHVEPESLAAGGTVPIEPRFFWDDLEQMRCQLDGPDLKYPVESQMRRGDVVTEILHAAEERDCDLIVMGSHGRRGLGRLLMGSAAEAILRRARCPVLTVKPAGARVARSESAVLTCET